MFITHKIMMHILYKRKIEIWKYTYIDIHIYLIIHQITFVD